MGGALIVSLPRKNVDSVGDDAFEAPVVENMVELLLMYQVAVFATNS